MQVGKCTNEKTAVEEIMVNRGEWINQRKEGDREVILKFSIPTSLTDPGNNRVSNRYKPAPLNTKKLTLDWS